MTFKHHHTRILSRIHASTVAEGKALRPRCVGTPKMITLIAALTPLERSLYEASLKRAQDVNARSMLAGGMTDDLILNLTGLEQEVLERLKGTSPD